jgi:hypothetical protein
MHALDFFCTESEPLFVARKVMVEFWQQCSTEEEVMFVPDPSIRHEKE